MTFAEGLEAAARKGHQLENDPPHALSRAQRFTCTKCGRAVLALGLGAAYGSALTASCPQGGRA